ncbi:MAG: M15 family peptidase, partial [Clostridium sp.]|nr:M15 family peptidase [Clostridium sp.]
MKYKLFVILSILFLISTVPIEAKSLGREDNLYIDNCKRDLLVLMMAYPDEIIDIEISEDNYIYLV